MKIKSITKLSNNNKKLKNKLLRNFFNLQKIVLINKK